MTSGTIQPNETAGIDCYVKQSGNTNVNDLELKIGESTGVANAILRTLLKFTGLSDGTIPNGATLSAATLTIKHTAASAGNSSTIRVYRQKRAWTETGAKWSQYDGSSNWQTDGGFGADDCEQTDIGSAVDSGGAGSSVAISLTVSAIQAIVNGTWTNNGFLLKCDTELNNEVVFISSGVADVDATTRPKLVVEYTLGGAMMTILLSM